MPTPPPILSIDQNSHSLWDVLPKLHALAAAGRPVRHFVEDIDAAFTSLGADLRDSALRLTPERFHHSGGADWGAALFYTEFLGRMPVELRDWEPLTGLKTAALARQLGRSIDDLYDEFSPSGNWQLVGSSFVGDREHHRVLGDLTVRETAEFVRMTLAKGREDTFAAFPSTASHQRLAAWFDREEALVAGLLDRFSDGRLVQLYEAWMAARLPQAAGRVKLDLTSRLFATAAPAGRELLDVFVADYGLASTLYNEAVAETDLKLRPLRRKDGELPFFATVDHAGHAARTVARLRDGQIVIGDRAFDPAEGGRLPVAAMADAGVRCLAGKALVLVSQVRLGEAARGLALPYRGSLYMPAAHRLARKLAAAGLLPGPLKPVIRVRFRLLDRLRTVETPIRLPPHLAAAMGSEEVPASRLGREWADLAAEAAARLETFRDDRQRQRWQQESFPKLFDELDALDRRRREVASKDPKAPELRAVWKTMRRLRGDLLDRTVRQIDRDGQVAELDYYDSRGALLPWCVALGGEAFYNQLIAEAEVYEEHGREPVP